MVAIVALLATTAVGVAAALAGYLPSKGYIRGGYEYSTAPFGGRYSFLAGCAVAMIVL
jgi:hypothetical protein